MRRKPPQFGRLPTTATAVPNWPGYKATRGGHVWSCRVRGRLTNQWKKLRPRKVGKYFSLTLCNNEKRQGFYLHHIILMTFSGPRPKGMEAIHKNDDQHDNRIKNLMWGTHKQNCELRRLNGKQTYGEQRKTSKLKEVQVRWIRANKHILTDKEMAAETGVGLGTVRNVIREVSWRHIL